MLDQCGGTDSRKLIKQPGGKFIFCSAHLSMILNLIGVFPLESAQIVQAQSLESLHLETLKFIETPIQHHPAASDLPKSWCTSLASLVRQGLDSACHLSKGVAVGQKASSVFSSALSARLKHCRQNNQETWGGFQGAQPFPLCICAKNGRAD